MESDILEHLPRILIVTPLLPPESGGPAYYAEGVGEAFKRAGSVVDMLAFREVRRYPSGVRHVFFFFKVLWRARSAEVLLILDTVSVALPAVLAGWLLRKKTIIRTGGDFVWEHYVERTKEKVLLSEFYTAPRALSCKERLLVWVQREIIFRLVSCIIFSTAWQRDIWTKPYAIPKEKTAIIENAFVREEKQKSERENVQEREKSGFLCAWRSTEFKNIDTLEKAFAIVRARFPSATLDLFRDIPRVELHERMQKARALIIPSLSEVSPNLALEALARGVPVILTQDCGMKDRLGDVVVWVDPKDIASVTEALYSCLSEEEYAHIEEKVHTFSFSRSYANLAKDFLVIFHET